ncbi:hypothetical protein SAMN05216311_11420 [Chitinophaga sp. CF418]|nr:hypothetical protein SAMN05216311_11420 [Chitinophaga sp. CF418]
MYLSFVNFRYPLYSFLTAPILVIAYSVVAIFRISWRVIKPQFKFDNYCHNFKTRWTALSNYIIFSFHT